MLFSPDLKEDLLGFSEKFMLNVIFRMTERTKYATTMILVRCTADSLRQLSV